MERYKSTSRRRLLRSASALGFAAVVAVAVWGTGCSALLNIDRFSTTQQGGTSGGGSSEGGGPGLYSDLVFTLQDMFPHKTHYFEYRLVSVNSNSVIARGAVENCGLGTISSSGADVPLTASKAIPTMGTGPLRLDFFAETSDNNHLFDEPDYSLASSSTAPNSPNFLIKDHSWQVGPPLVDTLVFGPLPDGGTSLAHVDGEVQVYFIHNPNTVDIDIDAITGVSNPPAGVGGDASFTLSNLDKYANTLLELRISYSSYNGGPTTAMGSPTGNVGLYRFPILSTGLGGGFNGMPALTRGKGSSYPGIAGVISASTNYIVDVYIDANNNGVYDNPATKSGDLGWRMYLTADSSGNLAIAFDPTQLGDGNVDVGPP